MDVIWVCVGTRSQARRSISLLLGELVTSFLAPKYITDYLLNLPADSGSILTWAFYGEREIVTLRHQTKSKQTPLTVDQQKSAPCSCCNFLSKVVGKQIIVCCCSSPLSFVEHAKDAKGQVRHGRPRKNQLVLGGSAKVGVKLTL